MMIKKFVVVSETQRYVDTRYQPVNCSWQPRSS